MSLHHPSMFSHLQIHRHILQLSRQGVLQGKIVPIRRFARSSDNLLTHRMARAPNILSRKPPECMPHISTSTMRGIRDGRERRPVCLSSISWWRTTPLSSPNLRRAPLTRAGPVGNLLPPIPLHGFLTGRPDELMSTPRRSGGS